MTTVLWAGGSECAALSSNATTLMGSSFWSPKLLLKDGNAAVYYKAQGGCNFQCPFISVFPGCAILETYHLTRLRQAAGELKSWGGRYTEAKERFSSSGGRFEPPDADAHGFSIPSKHSAMTQHG